MIRKIINESRNVYGIRLKSFSSISKKTFKCKCENDNEYFLKTTDLFTQDKFKFLYNQGIENVLYPIKNNLGDFITRSKNNNFYIMHYIPDFYMVNEVKGANLAHELTELHNRTAFKRQLSAYASRKKMDEIFNYLNYKFTTLELFIRTVEARKFDEYSITFLKNYHILLDAKKVMERLQRKIISDIKNKKSVYFSFIHNNPKLDHLLYSQGMRYLISIEKAKIGLPSLDLAKFYLENEHLNIDIKTIIMNYLDKLGDEFYFNYFCFLVLLYYVKGIVLIDKDYVSSQSFLFAAHSISKFLKLFNLLEENKTI
ncbi:MAG TPA: hypothetical protein GXZ48_01940 [Acholeplasmataceae bacterium]|nr:hypothetical protein [Acholeplasmataceae bacterium]